MSPRAISVFLVLALCGAQVTRAARADDRACDCACTPTGRTATTLDLNTADEHALLALPGIGPARARAILAFRASHGGFRSVSQLLNIKGIGRALLKELRPLVTISTTPR